MCVHTIIFAHACGYVCNYSVVCVLQGRHRPLVEASAQGHVGLVNMLLRYRADIDATGKVCITYIMVWYEKVCVHVYSHRMGTQLFCKPAPATTGV